MSLMCSSRFFSKRGGEELICILHLYYFLLKFTPDPLAKEILVNSSVALAGSVLLWLSPCYRAGWGRLPPHTERATCSMGLKGQEHEVRVQCRSPVLGWGRESCQDICLPRECQADGPISLRQAQLLLPSSTQLKSVSKGQAKLIQRVSVSHSFYCPACHSNSLKKENVSQVSLKLNDFMSPKQSSKSCQLHC